MYNTYLQDSSANKLVFDLDNTLVFTDKLNNEAYNQSLIYFGLSALNDYKRITRKVVINTYYHLSSSQINDIIRMKQEYFIKNMHITELNYQLVNILKSYKNESCILWTSAEEIRVQALLEHHNISDEFCSIIYSDKKNVADDVDRICELMSCLPEHLMFFENDLDVINEINVLKMICYSIEG